MDYEISGSRRMSNETLVNSTSSDGVWEFRLDEPES